MKPGHFFPFSPKWQADQEGSKGTRTVTRPPMPDLNQFVQSDEKTANPLPDNATPDADTPVDPANPIDPFDIPEEVWDEFDQIEPMENSYIILDHRGILSVFGTDARKFLQGLITNDMNKVTPDHAIYAALLTPQGKFLYDMFIIERDDTFFLDVEKALIPEILEALNKYKLRADVTILDSSDQFGSMSLMGTGINQIISDDLTPGTIMYLPDMITYIDPRTYHMDARAIYMKNDAVITMLDKAGLQQDALHVYDTTRYFIGIPDPVRDMTKGESYPLEYAFEDLNAIDFEKGCYVGQEVTARIKHRKALKRVLVAIRVSGNTPAKHTPILFRDKEVGSFCGAEGTLGIALLRPEILPELKQNNEPLSCGEAQLMAEDSVVSGY